MKNKDIFKKLVGLERGNKEWLVATSKTANSEKWLYHILPADAEAPNIEDEKNKKPFGVIAFFVLLVFILLSARLFTMEIINGTKNLSKAEDQRVHEDIVRAPRGVIYDSKGTPLVKNIPNYDLTLTPSRMPKKETDRQSVISALSQIIGQSASEINAKVTKFGVGSSQPLLLAKNIDNNQSLIIESRIKDLQGVSVDVNPIRDYLDSSLLSHVLGYVGRISESELKKNTSYTLTDFIGKTGLEKFYEKYLKGTPGHQKIEVDASGKPKKVLGDIAPIPGDNLKLALDFGLEQKLAQALKTQMDKAKVEKASAIAMNPGTGEILAMVDLPSYDNNLFAKGIGEKDYSTLLNNPNSPLLFRAISGEYPSGSVIKPFIASAALQEGTITESTTVNSTGGIKVGDFTFPDWKAGGHGTTNVTKAIAESVNTFFYAIGGGYQGITGLGPEKIKNYLEKFGFDNYTNIDVDGESKGSIPDPEWKMRTQNQPWYLGDTYHMSIGQGDILVTPLQIANATCAIANGGTLYKPRFVHSILDGNGNEKSILTSEIIKTNVVSAQTIDIVRRGMRQTVTSGSARALNTLPVEVAAKTGTAQFGPNNSKSHAWFSSFAPFVNPSIEITVLVEGAGGGDVYAAPVANEVYKWYFGGRQ